MMNDTILKCLLVEVGEAIGEIEYTTPRHEIVRVLDEATQKIAELGIKKKAAPVASTAPTKPVLRRPRQALMQTEEVLVVLYETNPDNSALSVRQWRDINRQFFDEYYLNVSNQLASLSNIFSMLVKKGFMVRHGNGRKHVATPTYQLTIQGIDQAKQIQGFKELMSDAYKTHIAGGRTYANRY